MLKRLFRAEPAPPWSYPAALGAIIAMFLAVIIGTTLSVTLLDETPITLMVGWCIGMTLTIVFVITSRRSQADSLVHLRFFDMPSNRLPLVALFALGMAVSLDVLSWFVVGDQTLASAELLSFGEEETISIAGWLIALVFLGMLQPGAEELVLRGVAFPSLRSTLGTGAGFYVVAVFHAAFHFLAYPPPPDDSTILIWYGAVLPLLDGLVFTGVRAYTGSTRASVVAHATFGIFAVLKVMAIG